MHATDTIGAGRGTCEHDHVVEFYENDSDLAESVPRLVLAGLSDGGAVVVIATREHRAQVAAQLLGPGSEFENAVLDGRYIEIDAPRMLSSLLVDGTPDRARFRDVVGAVIRRAAGHGSAVSVYGEMVGLLALRGDARSAVALEEMWNELGAGQSFELACGYPRAAFGDAERELFERICEQHNKVIGPERSAPTIDPVEAARVIAALREEAAGLRAALERVLMAQARLIEMAYHDPLTGLSNRRGFDDQLKREWALARRATDDSFLLVADLDGFKRINDTFGHAAGDEALRQFAASLGAAVRSTDLVARTGGDEFAVLLVRCDERATHAFRQRLHAAMREQMSERYRSIAVSIGHASLRNSDSPATALDRADLGMIAIKRANRRHRAGHAARR